MLWPAPARAHDTPGSALLIETGHTGLEAELRLPLVELEIAFGQRLSAQPGPALAQHEPALRDYVLRHLRLRAPDGRDWSMQVRRLTLSSGEAMPDLVVDLQLQPPAGAPLRSFTLHSTLIAHEVINHRSTVLLRRDFGAGVPGEPGQTPRVLASLGFNHHDANIALGPASRLAALAATVALGMRHIAEGSDHLLFLLALLLAAPLRVDAHQRRWAAPLPGRGCASRLLWLVSAFTLGHSLTLLLAAIGWLRLPAAPVEVAIAASVLLAAVHAWRPLFARRDAPMARREALVAGGFGLVHGLAFGGVIAELGLRGVDLALALAGFNLGVEAMQLLVVGALLPLLLLASRRAGYRWLRGALALAIGGAAVGWLAERALGWPAPLAAAFEALRSQRWWVLAVAVVALGAALRAARAALTATQRVEPG